MLGIGERPRADATVPRVIQPLRAVTLRTAFLHGDAIFEIRGVPAGDATLGGAGVEQLKDAPLEGRLADRVLSDQPGRLGAVLSRDVLGGPAVQLDQFAQPRRIPAVDFLHAWDVGSAELPGGDE